MVSTEPMNNEETTELFVREVWNYLDRNQLTVYALAKMSGVDNGALYNMIGGKHPDAEGAPAIESLRKPTPETVHRLAVAMDVNPLSLLVLAYPKFLQDLRVGPQDFDLISRFKSLTEPEQELLLRALRK